jgi:hypothetical protein
LSARQLNIREVRIDAIVNGHQVLDVGSASGPLLATVDREMLYDRLEMAIVRVEVDEDYAHHLECWGDYCRLKNLPASWRGRTDVYHYELLICLFKRLVPANREQDHGPRIRRRGWLRRATPDQQREATAWFKALDPQTRATLAQTYRFEDTAQRAERRYIERANREHRAELEMLRGH